MRDVDPVTQVEIIRIKKSSILPMMIYYASIAGACGLIDIPKNPKTSQYPQWYSISLSKSERKSLTYEEAQELKRYRWTLKNIRDRDIWPGMIL
jgi:hypothetical protein